jgi:hypothetical protein
MKIAASFALPALASAILFASPALALFGGNYTLTYYDGRHHKQGGSVCLSFTQTSNVFFFRDSGTWNSPDFDGWGGNFIVDGKYLRFYGTYPDSTGGYGVTNFYYRLDTGRGGFDQWTFSPAPIQALGDGLITLVSGCTRGRSQIRTPAPAN